MTKPLRVLLVEDREDDALLVLRHIERAGHDVSHDRVETAEAMRHALERAEWDVVISDYSLPRFSGPAALEVLRQSGMDLPFIMTSGTIGEETAVEALRAGAHDFMLKSNLARLVPAIERAMRDAEQRRAHRKAEEELRSMEEQMRHAQKMEAIGRLAGGVAHDFNNILTAILATADLALETPGLEPELRADLESIRESGKRAAAITRQLLLFSRKQMVQPRPVDLNEVVERMEPMLGRLLPARIALGIQRGAHGVVEADPTHIEQVLLNLVVNAGDAMPDGGTVTITTADMEVPALTTYDGDTLAPGRYVVLRVRDTGVGMTDEIRSRIFEPFFTTKEPGRGTGLGLATVYGIVQQAHGHVFVHSRAGEGALFEIVFPRVDAVPAASTTRTAEQIGLGGSEVILVVEDEAAVRAPICRALRQLGYFVLEAKHGEDALTILHDYHAPVHLVITDAVMPEMGGAELVRLLHAWYPQLKVLFVSGYSEELLKAQGALSPNASYLAKPFTPRALALAVRALLDEPQDGSSAV